VSAARSVTRQSPRASSSISEIPTDRPSTDEVFFEIELNYKAVLNGLALIAFAGLIYLTVRRGARDPVCGMRVDRDKAVRVEHAGGTYFFCSESCRDRFYPGVEVRGTPPAVDPAG
jgi:YHS domain-containing protein